MKFAAAGLALSLGIFLEGVSCAALTVGELQERMAQSDAGLKSVEFLYEQEMRSALSPDVRSASGRACFKKPRLLRIEQALPEKQIVVSSGKSVYVYTPRFRQVVQDSWARWTAGSTFFPGLPGFAGALENLRKNYSWEILRSEELSGEPTLLVRLRGAGAAAKEHLDLWVSSADFLPRKSELVAETLTLTTVLGSLKLNPDFEDDLFVFKKPADAELIRLR